MRELSKMTYQDVRGYLDTGPGIVVLPLGSTEEHGPHGPLGTDTFAASLVGAKVAERIDGVLAPAMPYGMACDQTGFAGTVALRPTTLALLLKEICGNFVRDGYRLVLVLSGHRGNDHAAITGLEEVGYSARTHLLYMCYQDANKGRLAELLGPAAQGHLRADDLKYGADGHGGSMELSVAMACTPGCVQLHKRSRPDRSSADALRSFPFKSILNIEEYAPTNGFFGDPSLCSEELGERIANMTADRIAAEIRRYLEAFPTRRAAGGS